jgi:hypothetical protein
LLKGTFKGGKLVYQEELILRGPEQGENVVTMMKVMGNYLAIGYHDGLFDLITLDSK